MTTKMKGLFKGLRYISQQIFDEEKEEEEDDFQIGLPTDVKHVAHIGNDGPSDETPSWMKGFKPSSSLDSPGASEGEDALEKGPKSPRKKNSTTKSRRNHSKDLSEDMGKSNRQQTGEMSTMNGSVNPKKTHKKKTKDPSGATRTKAKVNDANYSGGSGAAAVDT